MPKLHYTVVFERGDRPSQWLASVRELPECHTFGRGLAQTRARIREALVLWEGKKAKTAEIREVLPLPASAKKWKEELASFTGQMQRLLEARDEVVARLKSEAWSLRDIAEVLELSHQRVGQVSQQRRRTSKRAASAPK